LVVAGLPVLFVQMKNKAVQRRRIKNKSV